VLTFLRANLYLPKIFDFKTHYFILYLDTFYELFSPDSSCQFLPFLNSRLSLKHPKICATHTRAVEATTRNIKKIRRVFMIKTNTNPTSNKTIHSRKTWLFFVHFSLLYPKYLIAQPSQYLSCKSQSPPLEKKSLIPRLNKQTNKDCRRAK
jgi:hypothetical protein